MTVSGEDVTGLRIVTRRGTTIGGRVVSAADSTLSSENELRVVALPPGLAGGGRYVLGFSAFDFPPDSRVAADGAFEIAGASGRVQLDVPATHLMVKSVTLDGRDITQEALDLEDRDSVSGVVVTVTIAWRRSPDGCSIETVSWHQVRGDRVARRSDGRDRGATRIHVSRPDADGRFDIRQVRPGRYLAAAVEWIEPGGQLAPEFQERLRRGAREFIIGEGEALALDLTLAPDL